MDWAQLRCEFPSASSIVHMNHAGLAPMPLSVARAIRDFAAQALDFDAGTSARWETRREAVRAAAAQLVRAKTSQVAFVANTATGLSLIATGLEWQAGDNVVGVADEYPSNVYPWWGARRWGVETRLVPRRNLRFGVDDIAAAVDRRTRVVTVSAVDWQSGFRADLAVLAQFCRERDLILCVDAIQAVGAMQVDFAGLELDCIAAGGHKWLLAPEGCGVLVVSERLLERMHPVLLGWNSMRDPNRYLPYRFDLRDDAARFEPGTAPHLGIHALGAAIELLLAVGSAAIEARILDRTKCLAEGLRSRGAVVRSPWEPHERSGILTVELGDAAGLQAALRDAGVIARVRLGGVRLAPHAYASDADIAAVLAAVDDYRRRS